MMEQVMVGGATSEGQLFMGLSPMSAPEIVDKPPVSLAVMNATSTVSLDFNALKIPKDDIIVTTTAKELQDKDKHSTVFQASRSLGAARAAARFLSSTEQEAVLHHLERHHQAQDFWDQNPTWNEATELRIKALRLANEVIQAAFIAVGDRAHSLTHPLQRISREACFYSTTQLTQNLKTSARESFKKSLEAL